MNLLQYRGLLARCCLSSPRSDMLQSHRTGSEVTPQTHPATYAAEPARTSRRAGSLDSGRVGPSPSTSVAKIMLRQKMMTPHELPLLLLLLQVLAETVLCPVCAGSSDPSRGDYSDMFPLWLCQKKRPCLLNDDSARYHLIALL